MERELVDARIKQDGSIAPLVLEMTKAGTWPFGTLIAESGYIMAQLAREMALQLKSGPKFISDGDR